MAHPGFDKGDYPGDQQMQTWKNTSPYEFVGYYLKSPCHKSGSWIGKRKTLIGMGWNLLVVYVGQQSRDSQSCDANKLTRAQGIVDATETADEMAGEGFASRTYVYLDIEPVDEVSVAMKDYIGGWVSQLATGCNLFNCN